MICQVWKIMAYKMVTTCMVYVFCLSIGGLCYIIISIKMILHIKGHTHNFCYCSFDQIIYYIFSKQWLQAISNLDMLSPKEHSLQNCVFIHIILSFTILKRLWYHFIVFILVDYSTSHSWSKVYNTSKVILILFYFCCYYKTTYYISHINRLNP